MKRLYGNTRGLKKNQLKRLENIYRRKIAPQFIIGNDLARDLSRLSLEIRRQVGLLVNRQGKIIRVIVGDQHGIMIPDTREYRVAPGRLLGLRCIHTHLKEEPLSHDDLTDLALLRLDLMAAVTIKSDGLPHNIHWAHVMPDPNAAQPVQVQSPLKSSELDVDCQGLIQALETELSRGEATLFTGTDRERALLVSVSTAPRRKAIASLKELQDLAGSGGIHVIESILQQRKTVDTRYLMGSGKLKEIAITALQKGASLLIFDQELNASQIRSITDLIELKVIDRTQLILDIFAQRAQTREGKLQVELAQLKYLLPRLVTKNTAMSRLTGGIGGRGPGETKLEINRRRVRKRIGQLEQALEEVVKQRKQQRSLRDKRRLPVISIIGYTNAGKSTLLNTLTKSKVLAEKRLFATLDPSSRRLRFPRDTEVIITDTVGFIRNLPNDLIVAFRATLEELAGADLLLHVVDISNPRYMEQIQSVEKILADLNLDHIPVVRVLNKIDLVDPKIVAQLAPKLDGVPISARQRATLVPLITKMENAL
jgi:GTP-binding protein HflX